MTVLNNEETFLTHDLNLLESVEFKQRIKHIAEIIEEVQWQDIDPDVLTRFVGFLVPYLYPQNTEALDLDFLFFGFFR